MRDPARIPEMLKAIERFWFDHPDWRLGQIVSNMCDSPNNIDDETFERRDPFFIEDDELLQRLLTMEKAEEIARGENAEGTTGQN